MILKRNLKRVLFGASVFSPYLCTRKREPHATDCQKRHCHHFRQTETDRLAAGFPHLAEKTTRGGAPVGSHPQVRIMCNCLPRQLLSAMRPVGANRAIFFQEGFQALPRRLGNRQPKHDTHHPRPVAEAGIYDTRLPERHAVGLFPAL